MNHDEQFEPGSGPLPEEWRPLIEAHHQPPPTPREAMWERIQTSRRSNQPGGSGILPLRRPHWTAWVTGIAALLLVGIGVGRLSVGSGSAGVTDPATPITRPSTALNVATTQHLSKVETLLTGLRIGTDVPVLVSQARELLTTTRLFLDAPGLTDPALRGLLEDLELILVQVVRLQDADTPDELEFVTDGLDEHQVMLRLRRAIPAGPIRT